MSCSFSLNFQSPCLSASAYFMNSCSGANRAISIVMPWELRPCCTDVIFYFLGDSL